MAEKPILFNAEMVRAILEGRKIVTRRLVKPQPGEEIAYIWGGSNHGKWSFSPYNKPRYEEHRAANDWKYWTPPCHADDILYVRETWAPMIDYKDGKPLTVYAYRASVDEYYKNSSLGTVVPGWHPSIHMPREAARIWLRVTDVRVERLQEIDEDGIRSEGLTSACVHAGDMEIAAQEFALLWNSTIKPADRDRYGWAANPWVWVIAFERIERPVTLT